MSDCRHCDWHNIYRTCQDGSRELAIHEHMAAHHPDAPPHWADQVEETN